MARLHVIQGRQDNQVAQLLIDGLKRAGHSVSIDFTYLVPGVEWNRSLREAVLAADGLVAILSRNSVERDTGRITSQWIASDIGAARATGKFVIPVLVGDDCPIPTLIDDVFVLRMPVPGDRRLAASLVGQISEAVAYHLDRRGREAALNLPPGYFHLGPSVLRCREDVPFDRAVFVMMKFPDPATMESRDVQLLTDIWHTLDQELARHGLTARRADERAYEDQLWENICVYMLSCRYGLAVLEDHAAQELNPNVTLEYGFMKAMNRRVALLRDVKFVHDRADLTGKLAKQFEISRAGVLGERSLRGAVRDWLVDIGRGASARARRRVRRRPS